MKPEEVAERAAMRRLHSSDASRNVGREVIYALQDAGYTLVAKWD